MVIPSIMMLYQVAILSDQTKWPYKVAIQSGHTERTYPVDILVFIGQAERAHRVTILSGHIRWPY